MKRILCLLLLLTFILPIFCISSYSSTINVQDYLKEKFPTIFSLYLASFEDLDPYEKGFIDLLEKLPKGEQEYYAREVYRNGFSLELLDNLKKWKKTEERPSLNLAYPWRSEQRIWGSPLFVFGTTDPSPTVRVTVNDKEVEKYDFRTGNFLTLVEVPRDEEFSIVVEARRGGKSTSVERTVNYPHSWEEMPRGPLAIHSTYLQPKQDQVIRKGDGLRVMIQGSPEAEAVFQIGGNLHEIAMKEIDDLPWPLQGKGIYVGSYTVRAEDVPFFGETSPQAITVTLHRGNKEVSRELPGRVSFVSSLLSRIVEVTNSRAWLWRVREDSFVLHSSTQGGDGLSTGVVGYYLLPGTRFEVVGTAGDHLRVNLDAENYLIHKENVRELGYAIKKPFTLLSELELNETKEEVNIRFNTQERIPFLLEDGSRQLKLILYGAKSRGDLIKRGDAPSVKNIEIESPVRDRADTIAITIELDLPLAGFDYRWAGTELVIILRKPAAVGEDNPLRERIIVIDPGHGGKYPGAVGPADIHERDVVLEIGKFLQNMLEDRGAEVIMTRTQDENVDLYERIDNALKLNADLFISIHANAHGDGADAIKYHGHMTLYNYAYNQELANIMLDNLVERMGLPQMGVRKRNDLAVLRRPQVPSVLIETAYMMHPEDNWYLLQPINQKEFARAIMHGIIEYFRLSPDTL